MGMILSPFASSTGANYAIKNAALFDGVSGYLSRTPSVAGNGGVWSFSCWAKPTNTGTTRALFSDGATSFTTGVLILSTDQIAVDVGNQINTTFRLTTTAVFRDVSAWLHIFVAVYTSAATASDRVKLYVNGVLQSVTGTYPTSAFGGGLSTSYPWAVGYNNSTLPYYHAGCLAEVAFTDGHALNPTAFGKTDPVSGNWAPKSLAVAAYGANGFYLNFQDGSSPTAMGLDSSGNSNTFSVTISVSQRTDAPTNNYATWNALDSGGAPAFGFGDTRVYLQGAGDEVRSTLAMDDGKYYAEFPFSSGVTDGFCAIGFCLVDTPFVGPTSIATIPAYAWVYRDDGYMITNAIGTAGYTNYASGQTIAVAVNISGGVAKLWFGIVTAGVTTWEGGGDPAADTGAIFGGVDVSTKSIAFYATAANGTATTTYYDMVNSGFSGTVPSGFKGLCTDNLPPVTGKNVHDHFNTVTYAGGAPTITGVGFRPDFMWVKSRSLISNHVLFDSVRGLVSPASAEIYPNLTNVEAKTSAISSISSDGWAYNLTDANYNSIGDTYVAWCAKLPNIVTSGWAGTPSITPTEERCNPTLGMSIVSWTGNATLGATIPHSLGKKPAVVIVKNRDLGIGQWFVYHKALGATNYLLLEDVLTTLSSVAAWNNTEPTAQLVTLGNFDHVNGAGNAMIAYLFAESDFVKIGRYTGNGVADGPFLNAGVSPAWVMTKRTDAADDWYIQDDVRAPYNPRSAYVRASATAPEDTSVVLTDFTAAGVKTRTALTAYNALGGTYVYLMIGQPTGGRNTTEAVGR